MFRRKLTSLTRLRPNSLFPRYLQSPYDICTRKAIKITLTFNDFRTITPSGEFTSSASVPPYADRWNESFMPLMPPPYLLAPTPLTPNCAPLPIKFSVRSAHVQGQPVGQGIQKAKSRRAGHTRMHYGQAHQKGLTVREATGTLRSPFFNFGLRNVLQHYTKHGMSW